MLELKFIYKIFINKLFQSYNRTMLELKYWITRDVKQRAFL